MTIIILCVFVAALVLFVIRGTQPVYKIAAKVVGTVDRVEMETGRLWRAEGISSRRYKSYCVYIRYSYQGQTYTARAEQEYDRVKCVRGDSVLVGVNDRDRSSVRIIEWL